MDIDHEIFYEKYIGLTLVSSKDIITVKLNKKKLLKNQKKFFKKGAVIWKNETTLYYHFYFSGLPIF